MQDLQHRGLFVVLYEIMKCRTNRVCRPSVCSLFECVELSVFVMISRVQQQCVCIYVCGCVISVITSPLLYPPVLGKLALWPGLSSGRAAVWRLLLSEWPSLLLIYSSTGTLLIFTSTGDTGLLKLTIILQFMVMQARSLHCTFTTHRVVCAEVRLQGGIGKISFNSTHLYK